MIRQLGADDILDLGSALCCLLADAVDNGASVGFLPPLDPIEALVYWDSVREGILENQRILLAAFEGDELIGTVQLDLSLKANARHRGEVVKLLVHRKARRRGLGTALMRAIEQAAVHSDLSLLVLDTRKGDPSERLYRKLGYVAAGEIPNYAQS